MFLFLAQNFKQMKNNISTSKYAIVPVIIFILFAFLFEASAQNITTTALTYDGCMSVDVQFTTNVTCPVGNPCFGIIIYEIGDEEATERDTLPEGNANITNHTYDDAGRFGVRLELRSQKDSTEIISAKVRNNMIAVYDPSKFSANYKNDTAENAKSYIKYFQAGADAESIIDSSAWVFQWDFDGYNESGEPFLSNDLSEMFELVYPDENLNPGYLYKLTTRLSEDYISENYLTGDYAECEYRDTGSIKIEDEFFTEGTRTEEVVGDRIPDLFNVITPDGNPNDESSANDVFQVTTNGVDEFTVWIYNAWGTVVFTKTGKDISWTGNTNSGKRVRSGTYYYAIESNAAPDGKHTATGFIHVFNEDF